METIRDAGHDRFLQNHGVQTKETLRFLISEQMITVFQKLFVQSLENVVEMKTDAQTEGSIF